MTFRLSFITQPAPELRSIILDGLRDFNQSLFASSVPSQDFAIALSDADDASIGGLWGRVAGNWLAIELIFVPVALRGQGLATRLVALAEEEARRRGCRNAWLETLNPQAFRLYESLGYRSFGELEDYAEGNSRFFMRKVLGAS